MKSRTEFTVEVESMESVTITDVHGEIVTWIKDEWIEDPDLVPTAIANAIVMAYERGPEALRESIGHPGERTGFDYRRYGDVVVLLSDTRASNWDNFQSDPAHYLKAGIEGIVYRLSIGHFMALFNSGHSDPVWQQAFVDFDWGDEGETYVFKERVGYGDVPNEQE